MKELRFQGFSDDTFSIIAPKEFVDELDCYDSVGEFYLSSKALDVELLITGTFTNEGWRLGFAYLSNSKHESKFIVSTIKGDYKHSPILIVQCPDDVVVTSNQSDDE